MFSNNHISDTHTPECGQISLNVSWVWLVGYAKQRVLCYTMQRVKRLYTDYIKIYNIVALFQHHIIVISLYDYFISYYYNEANEVT